MSLFGNALLRLEKVLDVRLVKSNILAGNIANVDTPGYTARDVDFNDAMATAYEPGRLSNDERQELWAVDAEGFGAGFDQNSVDLDRTMASLSANATQYAAATRAAGKKLAILKYAASDGA